MPSAFATRFAASSLGALYERFGVAATYTGTDGVEVACTVRVQRGENRQFDGKSGAVGEAQPAEVFVRVTEIPRPVKDGRFEADGEVWSVQLSPTLANGQFKCSCMRINAQRRAERRDRANG